MDTEQNRGSRTSVVTIAVAAGVSAVVSAIVVTVGVVGMMLLDQRDTTPQTVVAALPSGLVQQSAAAPGPADPEPADPKAAASKPADPKPADDKTPAPAAATPTVPPAAQPAAVVQRQPEPAAEPEPAEQAPTAASVQELTGKLQVLLNPGASADAKSAQLQAGGTAMPSVNAVGSALKTAGPVYKWALEGPVAVDGDTLTAQLKTSLIGFGDRRQPLTWKWIDGNWKLSNASVCSLAATAMVPCSV